MRRQSLKFNGEGLIPAIVQDARTGAVLMLAYMNRSAFSRTLRTGQSYFWSRSRQELWRKGAQSGNVQRVVSVMLDCDQDTVLLQVEQTNVACHTGRYSCFFNAVPLPRRRSGRGASSVPESAMILDRVYEVILDRKRHPKKDSYVSGLLTGGKDRILKKISEEAGELVLGSKNNRKKEIIGEAADLWFHSLVVLGFHDIPPQAIYRELAERFGRPPRPGSVPGVKKKKVLRRRPKQRGRQ